MRYRISQEEKAEIEKARKNNHDKKIDSRLRVLVLRAEGKTLKEISEFTGYDYTHVSVIISQYAHKGLSYFLEKHYVGNRRNMSYEQEDAIIAPFREQAEKGQVVSVAEIAQAYQAAVDHPVSPTQIYAVLKRHGWRKVMPRSRHPKKASEEVIATSKKLNLKSKN